MHSGAHFMAHSAEAAAANVMVLCSAWQARYVQGKFVFCKSVLRMPTHTAKLRWRLWTDT